MLLIYEYNFLKWKEWSVEDLPKLKKLVFEILLETREKESLLFKSKDRSLIWTTPASK